MRKSAKLALRTRRREKWIFLWVFPDFPRKNNKIKSRNKDQTFVILTNKYTHIKYCLKYIVHFACSYAKSLQFIGYLKMKIKAQQMTFRQDITKYKIYWLTFRCIIHNIFRAIGYCFKIVFATSSLAIVSKYRFNV